VKKPEPLTRFLTDVIEDARHALDCETRGALDADIKAAVAKTLTNAALRLRRDLKGKKK